MVERDLKHGDGKASLRRLNHGSQRVAASRRVAHRAHADDVNVGDLSFKLFMTRATNHEITWLITQGRHQFLLRHIST